MQKQFVYLVLLLTALVAGIYYTYALNEENKIAKSASQPKKLIQQSNINLGAIVKQKDNIDSIQKIMLLSANNTLLNVFVDKNQWRAKLEGSDVGFPIEDKYLTALLRSLLNAKVIERKSANPQNHSRLGLLPLSSPDANGVLLKVNTKRDFIEVLIGNEATLQNGQYVRFNNNDQMLLVDQTFNLPQNSMDWLQKSLFNFSLSDVASVQQKVGGKEGWLLVNERQESLGESLQLPPETERFSLEDFKTSEQVAYPNIEMNYVSNLISIKFNDLIKSDAPASKAYDIVSTISFRTFSDQLYILDVLKTERLVSNSDQTEQVQGYAIKVNSPNYNDFLNEWLFIITDEQAENLLKNRNDFIKTL